MHWVVPQVREGLRIPHSGRLRRPNAHTAVTRAECAGAECAGNYGNLPPKLKSVLAKSIEISFSQEKSATHRDSMAGLHIPSCRPRACPWCSAGGGSWPRRLRAAAEGLWPAESGPALGAAEPSGRDKEWWWSKGTVGVGGHVVCSGERQASTPPPRRSYRARPDTPPPQASCRPIEE